MTLKYKLSTAFLCIALSPLTHAGVTYCNAGGSYSYEYGSGILETVECTTPTNTRIYADQGQTLKAEVTSTINQSQYQHNSKQVAAGGYFSIRRNVKWKPDVVFYDAHFSGTKTYYIKKDTTGNNQFHANVKSHRYANWAWAPRVSIILNSY